MKAFGCRLILSLIALGTLSAFLLGSLTSEAQQREILGWYCIDWGPDYYMKDFEKIKAIHIDSVILRSFEYDFVSNSEAFIEAIEAAHKIGLKVGVSVFHPSHSDLLKVWELPIDHKFADFTANKTWIETVYAEKLRSVVNVGESFDLVYYVFDDMEFDRASNMSNAQLFIDITFSITDGKAMMLAYYRPEQPSILNLSIPSWDWYNEPGDLDNFNKSLTERPMNNTVLGCFVWLHRRMGISFSVLSKVFDLLTDTDRIHIFPLRYGGPAWTDGVSNSILEHPVLMEHIRKLNLRYISHEYYGTLRLSHNPRLQQPHVAPERVPCRQRQSYQSLRCRYP